MPLYRVHEDFPVHIAMVVEIFLITRWERHLTSGFLDYVQPAGTHALRLQPAPPTFHPVCTPNPYRENLGRCLGSHGEDVRVGG